MGLGSLVRNAVATAHRITHATDGLQATVSFRPWTGQDADTAPTYGSTQPLPAIVEYLTDRRSVMRTPAGEDIVARVRLLFLSLPAAVTATGRQGLVDPRDLITLPDSTTYPVVAVGGVVDPDTDAPYALEVWVG